MRKTYKKLELKEEVGKTLHISPEFCTLLIVYISFGLPLLTMTSPPGWASLCVLGGLGFLGLFLLVTGWKARMGYVTKWQEVHYVETLDRRGNLIRFHQEVGEPLTHAQYLERQSGEITLVGTDTIDGALTQVEEG